MLEAKAFYLTFRGGEARCELILIESISGNKVGYPFSYETYLKLRLEYEGASGVVDILCKYTQEQWDELHLLEVLGE